MQYIPIDTKQIIQYILVNTIIVFTWQLFYQTQILQNICIEPTQLIQYKNKYKEHRLINIFLYKQYR